MLNLNDYKDNNVRTKLFDMNTSENTLVDYITNLENYFVVGIGNMVGWGENFLQKLKEYEG